MFNKNKIIIVAEIGNNHEGSLKTAKLLMKEAKKCGVDAVKFQTFIPDLYVHKKDKKRFKQLKKFQLSFDDFKNLALFAKKLKITFFSTPFDLESASFLNKIQKCLRFHLEIIILFHLLIISQNSINQLFCQLVCPTFKWSENLKILFLIFGKKIITIKRN